MSRLTSAIREVGEVLSTLPAPGEAPEAQIRFSLLVASDAPAGEVVSRLGLPAGAVRLVRAGAAAGPPPAAQASPERGRRVRLRGARRPSRRR